MSSIIPTWPKPHLTAEQRRIAEQLKDPSFNLTRFMQEEARREADGTAAAEREAAQLAADKLKAEQDAKVELEQRKRAMEAEAAREAMIARANADIERIRAQNEQSFADHQAARHSAMLTQKPISVGELQNRMASIAAARKA